MGKRVDWKIRLHSGGQNEVFDCKSTFRIVPAGRRWGKSTLAGYIAIDFAKSNPGLPIWWVAPTYEVTEVGRRKIFRLAPKELLKPENKQRRILPFITDAYIQFKSSDNPDSLLGEAVGLLIIDEAGKIRDEVFYQYLEPILIDHQAPMIAIGTPRGKNWFYDFWLKGQDPLQPDYKSFSFPTIDNPTLNRPFLEKIFANTPEHIRQQEYEASFLEDTSLVFRGISDCAVGQLEEPKPGHRYKIGIDVAKYHDFWVSIVIDRMPNPYKVVGFERSNKLDWNFQKARTIVQAQKWNNAEILIDSTGVGDPIFEDLSRAGLSIKPYQFTSPSKKLLIENLALMIEQRQIIFPPIPELINELKSFEYELTRWSNIRYGAPSGKFDDCVISLGLACWGLISQPALISTENFLTGIQR